MEDENKVKYVWWLIANILLPLLPVLIKLIISLLDDKSYNSFEILDSSELLYYNFVICISFLKYLLNKNANQILDIVLGVIIFLVFIVDIALLVLYYEGINSKLPLKVTSILLSILVPVVVCSYNYKNEVIK